MALKGLIIYFDGPDGVGKTTQLTMAQQELAAAGHEVYIIHALGGSPLSDMLSQVMMSPYPRPAETDLYIALAAQYAALKDLEAQRAANKIILVDRSPLSIIAYQVFAGGLDSEKGYREASELLAKVDPDLVLVYQASPENRLQRRQTRNIKEGENYFEKMPAAYHDETAKGYAEASTRLGATVIDADDSIENVHQATMAKIMALLKA